jgi:hypothetical protein
MTEQKPLACSLGTSDLRRRLEEIAEIGAASMIGRNREDDLHVLRFRSSVETRRRLERIVAAEAECCSFLDLKLSERDGELILSVAAPEGTQPIVEKLASAFTMDTHSGPAPWREPA